MTLSSAYAYAAIVLAVLGGVFIWRKDIANSVKGKFAADALRLNSKINANNLTHEEQEALDKKKLGNRPSDSLPKL